MVVVKYETCRVIGIDAWFDKEVGSITLLVCIKGNGVMLDAKLVLTRQVRRGCDYLLTQRPSSPPSLFITHIKVNKFKRNSINL